MDWDGFALINDSALLQDTDLQAMAAALAIFWERDFAPAWDLPAVQFRVFGALEVPSNWVPCILTDTIAAPDDLAFHSELGGTPNIQVQVPTITGAGGGILVPLSEGGGCVSAALAHEVAETGADPLVNLVMPDPTSSATDALEVADPVQDNSYSITLPNGSVVWVSDFVTPRWFDRNATLGAVFDQMGLCRAPFEIVRGYMVQYDGAGNPSEIFGDIRPNRPIRLASRRRQARLSRVVSPP